jgi:hypothetical protein
MPSQHPSGQLQKQRNIKTYIIKDNKQGTYETHIYKTKDRKLKSLIIMPYNNYNYNYNYNAYYNYNYNASWSKVILNKLTGFQLVMNFPAFYGTRRFITAFTSGRHLPLCRATLIQSILSHPTSRRSILRSFHLLLGLPSGFFPSGFPPKLCIHLYCPSYLVHTPLTSFFSIL